VAFEIRPFPEFSWSNSRDRLLRQCPRAYFYRYYLSWNGWLREATEQSRLAYRLSKLTSLDALLGQEIDKRAREIERALRAGHSVPPLEMLEQRTRAGLRRAWRSSKERRRDFESRPKGVTMIRHLYLDEDGEAEVARVEAKIVPCLENLLAVPHWERLAECGEEGQVSIPDFAHTYMGDIKVYGALDLAYVHQGTLHVIDWKSGRQQDSDEFQVLISAWVLTHENENLKRHSLEGHLHYLSLGIYRAVQFPDDLASEVEAGVLERASAMQSFLFDPRANKPLEISEFPRHESALCSSCNFAPLCEGSE